MRHTWWLIVIGIQLGMIAPIVSAEEETDFEAMARRAQAVSQAAENEPEERKTQTEKEHTIPSTTPAGQSSIKSDPNLDLLLNSLWIQQQIKQQQHKACKEELPPDQRFHCFETPSATFDPSAKFYERNQDLNELKRKLERQRSENEKLFLDLEVEYKKREAERDLFLGCAVFNCMGAGK